MENEPSQGITGAPRARPVDVSERIPLLDVLRGFALGGVFVSNVNLWFSGRVFLPPERAKEVLSGTLNTVAGHGFMYLGFGKFMTLFSTLFGLGFAVQMLRAEDRGSEVAPIYARRLGVLLAIGLAHMFGLWLGDILGMYALMGFGLLLFRKKSNKTLLLWAFGLILIAPLAVQGAEKLIPLLWKSKEAMEAAEASAMGQMDVARSEMLAAMQSPSYLKVLKANAKYVKVDLLAWHSIGLLLVILGKFLLGFYAGRRQIFNNVAENRGFFLRLLGWGLGIGVVASSARLVVRLLTTRNILDPMGSWRFVMGPVSEIGMCGLAAAYAAIITLLFQRPLWRRILSLLAPAGRMALSNYLFQSVMGLLVFYGFGLGYAGKWGPAQAIAVAAGLFTVQIGLSHLWLSRFRFGPAEWAWRSLTYGEAQPMRISSSIAPKTPISPKTPGEEAAPPAGA
jgi:uncharacterized protein